LSTLRAQLSADVVKLGPPLPFERELRLTIPSEVARVGEAVELVARHVEERFECQRTVSFNMRVALTEAISNAILYGNSEDVAKGVEVRVRFGPTAVEIEVTDQGQGFDPGTVPDPTLPENLQKPNGRGLFLIGRLVDEVRFNAKGNSICMILRRA
jgi:serine/threonine-protein kinase RsbW